MYKYPNKLFIMTYEASWQWAPHLGCSSIGIYGMLLWLVGHDQMVVSIQTWDVWFTFVQC